jgi:acyl-coenzyme A thioesterase PaaI-like protein
MAGKRNRLPKVPVYTEPSDEVRRFLQSIPWASKLLSDPTLRAFNGGNRKSKPSTREDSLLAETLANEDAFKTWQSFHRSPCASAPLGEFIFVITLGSGLNGHSDTLHGGVVGLLMDEIMGYAALYTRSPEMTSYTATMTLNYKKPILTPSVILCRSTLEEKSQGRKMWTSGTLEDGEGGIYATGTALFIETKRPTKL